MHRKSQTPNFSDDALRLRDEVLRSCQPADPRHRLGADDDPNRIGQGTQGTVGAALTETFERVESLLGEAQTGRLTVPAKADHETLRGHDDSQSNEGGRGESGDQAPSLSARAEAFLRDGTARSRRGLVDDQSAARSRKLRHDDEYGELRGHLFAKHVATLTTADQQKLNDGKHPSQSHALASDAEPYCTLLDSHLKTLGVNARKIELGCYHMDRIVLTVTLDDSESELGRKLPWLFQGFEVFYMRNPVENATNQ